MQPPAPAGWVMDVVRHLAQTGRGSCTAEQKAAGVWAAEQLRALGAQDVTLEPFRGAPSTYRPFTLAFALAALGSAAALAGAFGRGEACFAPTTPCDPINGVLLSLGALFNLLGAWMMFAESDLKPHLGTWLLPRAPAQNVTAMLPPGGAPRRNVVLCAHLDTHRTPVFYSSAGWQRVFSLLVTVTFLSMALGGAVLGVGAAYPLLTSLPIGSAARPSGGAGIGASLVGILAALMLVVQAFVLLMMATADHTPFSPGANDDASGVGVILALVEQLQAQPLQHTRVHIALTDCEETGAWGMRAYLDRHAKELGKDAVYIILDEVGLETLKFLCSDGLMRKHATHPQALDLLRGAAAALPEIPTTEQVGLAYTDALVATQRGLIALTLCSVSTAGGESAAHWHQMSDTPQFVSPQALENTQQFVWHILQVVDGK